MVTAIMVSALLIGALALAYAGLLHYGIEPLLAMFIVAIVSIVVIVMLVFAVLLRLHHLRRMPTDLLRRSNSASISMNLIDSFLDGFMKD